MSGTRTTDRPATNASTSRPVDSPGLVRRLVPQSLVPLAMIAGVLAAVPWLHSFPASTIGVPVFGAAILSALLPTVAAQLGVRSLWLSLLIDLAGFLLYALIVVLHEPIGFGDLARGLYHGPSQILTFALPLVSPRSLFVPPVALCWIAGALAGECLSRRWFTILPFPGFLVSYALAYAATVRARDFVTADARANQTLIAALLLATLLLLRVAQTWVRQDETAESTQADGILPLRGLAVGTATTVVVALLAGLTAQSPAFGGHSSSPERVPSVHDSRPLSPVAFVGSLRPANPDSAGTPVFTVQTDRPTLGYFSIANADQYNGAGWGFTRTFRPSGGVLPNETDSELDGPNVAVTQTYRIANGPLVGAPWMPYLYRPQQVTGASINIDPNSGMIVPAGALRSGERYRVTSDETTKRFAQLSASARIATGTSSDGNVPASLGQTLEEIVRAFEHEVGVNSSPAVGFLQALQQDLRSNYSLSGGVSTESPTPSAASGQPTRRSPTPRNSPTPTGPPATPSPGARAGSASFADVLASVVGPDRTGSPEQYATLVALIARRLGVPARVVSGFRVSPPSGSTQLPSGTYAVTTAEAWTWVEIPIIGAGWVVLDPAPSTYSTTRHRPSVAASALPSPSASPSQNALVTKSNAGHAVAPKSSVPSTVTSSLRTVVTTLLAVLGGLLVVLLIALVARKQVRRRRRQRLPDPRARALAAWAESIDLLTEAGLPDLSALTGTEIVALTGERFGPDSATPAGQVSDTAQAAAYSTATLVNARDADAAWAAQDALRKGVLGQLSFRERVWAWLRYHRNRPATRAAAPGPRAGAGAERGRRPKGGQPRHRRDPGRR